MNDVDYLCETFNRLLRARPKLSRKLRESHTRCDRDSFQHFWQTFNTAILADAALYQAERETKIKKNNALVKAKTTEKTGRGVFAMQDLNKNQLFLVDPIYLLLENESQQIENISFRNYVFDTGSKYYPTCIDLGLGSIINHSRKENCFWKVNLKRKEIVWRTTRKIRKGEQLLHDYRWEESPSYLLD